MSSSSFICCNTIINPSKIQNNCKNFCKTSNNPPNIYQTQKIIQNTVRVPSSLYTMNIGALNAYQTPDKFYHNVYWKQMSDRKIPHIQNNIVPTTKGRHHSYTWHRPGCQSPGGKGVDMKHGSYDRYLNKIKGKQPLRRGIIPPITPTIVFNRGEPIYGGKTFKTNIVSGYNCPICENENGDKNIYKSFENQIFGNTIYTFKIGDIVLVFDTIYNNFNKATIIQILDNNNYLVQFTLNKETSIVNITSLYIENNKCFNKNCSDNTVVQIVPDYSTLTTTSLFERFEYNV